MSAAWTLERILERARATESRLPYEVGAFVVLEACEAILDAPRKLEPAHVAVSEGGDISLLGGETSDDSAAARGVANLLASALVAAGDEIPAMLMALIDGDKAEARGLAAYRDELEAALVPLNRSAARRVLGRQLRDLGRMRSSAGDIRASAEDVRDADAALDAILGYDGPSVAPEVEAPLNAEAGADADELPASAPRPSSAPLARTRDPDLAGIEERSEGGGGLRAYVVVVLIAAIATGLYVWLRG